jgi:L-tartrate/succinate antiporter
MLILEPIPAAAVGLVGVTAATVSMLVVPNPADAIKWALSGFQDGMVSGSSSLPLCHLGL